MVSANMKPGTVLGQSPQGACWPASLTKSLRCRPSEGACLKNGVDSQQMPPSAYTHSHVHTNPDCAQTTQEHIQMQSTARILPTSLYLTVLILAK